MKRTSVLLKRAPEGRGFQVLSLRPFKISLIVSAHRHYNEANLRLIKKSASTARGSSPRSEDYLL